MYTVSTREPLPPANREALATAITDTHCALTGAPPIFVNVVFSHGIPLDPAVNVHLLANVRKGRSEDTNRVLTGQMAERLWEILEVPGDRQKIVILEIPARWVMEGGEVLPEPGEEANSKWGWQTPSTSPEPTVNKEQIANSEQIAGERHAS